jgi:Phage integrase family
VNIWAPACRNSCRPQERRRDIFNMTSIVRKTILMHGSFTRIGASRGTRSAHADAPCEGVHRGNSGDMRGGCGYSLLRNDVPPRALDPISENVIWYVVRRCAQRMELEHLAPHDLRRTCAKLCHVNGGELEQIQFLLGHASVLTIERYLGCKQNLEELVNDRFGCLFSRLSMNLR